MDDTTRDSTNDPTENSTAEEPQPTDPTEQTHSGGMPGDGVGRRDEVRGSGVYPASGPLPENAGDLHFTGQAGWGQGPAGPAGYEDSGESEISPLPGQVGAANEDDEEEEPLPPAPAGQR